MKRAVAITLKIPDNTAYTAAVALRNLGLPVERVERSEIWFFDDAGDAKALLSRIEADATIFNPNKHRAMVLEHASPGEGELWIEPLDARQGAAAIAWRLFVSGQRRADRRLLGAAADGLLCNPAIERALRLAATPLAQDQDDNGGVSE
jgi:hypothetical protein